MARILIISCMPYGRHSRTKRHAETLAACGNSVDVLCLGNLPAVSFDGVNVTALIRVRSHSSGRIRRLCHFHFVISAIFRATRSSISRPYDVVVVHAIRNATLLCAAVLGLFGSRIIPDLSDEPLAARQRERTGQIGPLRARLLILGQAIRAKLVSRLLVAEATHGQLLKQAGVPASKIRVVLDVPEPVAFEPHHQSDDDTPRSTFTIVSQGASGSRFHDDGTALVLVDKESMSSILGVDVAIHALSFLWSRIPNIHLRVIGGSDAYVARAKAVVQFLNLHSHVTFDSQVSPEAVPAISENTSLGVFSTDFADDTGVVLPQQLIRYAALGIPCVAPRLRTVEPYFSEDAVRFYEPGNARALARTIEDLCNRPEIRREMVLRAKARAESLASDQRRQLLEAMDSLFENQPKAQPVWETWTKVGWQSVEWLRGRRSFWPLSYSWRAKKPALIILKNRDMVSEKPMVLGVADAITRSPASGVNPTELELSHVIYRLRGATADWCHRLEDCAGVIRRVLKSWRPQYALPIACCRRCKSRPLNPTSRFCTRCGAHLESQVILSENALLRRIYRLCRAPSRLAVSMRTRLWMTTLKQIDDCKAIYAMARLVGNLQLADAAAPTKTCLRCGAKRTNPRARFCTKCGGCNVENNGPHHVISCV